MEPCIRNNKRHNLYVRTYTGECAKIMFHNFSAVYEPVRILNMISSPSLPISLNIGQGARSQFAQRLMFARRFAAAP